jgi:hypothetical protein
MKRVPITDHAIVRYLERGLNIDIDELKHSILSNAACQVIMRTGDGRYPLDRDLVGIVKDGTLITIHPATHDGDFRRKNVSKKVVDTPETEAYK